MFKVPLSVGDSIKLAIAMGFLAPGTATLPDTAKNATTVLFGVAKPALISLCHISKNSQDPTLRDILYMPRVQVQPSLTLKMVKGEVKQVEATFFGLPSLQDGSTGTPTSEDFRILDPVSAADTGMHASSKEYHENNT